jgi:TonB family protein
MRLSFALSLAALTLVSCATSPAPAPEVTAEEAARLRTESEQARHCPNRTNPVVITKVEPDYPSDLRRTRVEGVVIVEGIITTDGQVVAVRVVRSLHPDLSAAAIKAARRWRYRPAGCSGQPVSSFVTLTLTFNLH